MKTWAHIDKDGNCPTIQFPTHLGNIEVVAIFPTKKSAELALRCLPDASERVIKQVRVAFYMHHPALEAL